MSQIEKNSNEKYLGFQIRWHLHFALKSPRQLPKFHEIGIKMRNTIIWHSKLISGSMVSYFFLMYRPRRVNIQTQLPKMRPKVRPEK